MSRLRIAVQKSGRLHDDSVALLRECGIDLRNVKDRLRTESDDFPLEVFFLRDDDIPQYVEDGVADIGIVGQNVLLEKGRDVEVVQELGFGKCRLSLAVPRSESWEGVPSLEGRRIATSYPRIVGDFLARQGVRAEIHEISGSVEIAPGIGLADVVADLVSSGGTLFMNGLREVEPILQSQAVLVKNKGLDASGQRLLESLLFRIRAVKRAKRNKYVLLNAPNDRLADIVALLPGMKSPTVLPLAESGWSSVHSVLSEEEFWDRIERLKAAGAQGILVVPIEKMVL
ncbi:MAG: ATP phosphoribosyltransferase [Chitinophagia bacterium]|nr:ATP phosphoribosyltransferase [Chitinophagia bacterium]